MRTGLFYLFESLEKKSVLQVYRDAVAEAVHGEELGFAGVHPAEHHFADHYGIMPRVELFLAKVAGLTKTIRLTPMVTVAPLADALRLAEDSALLDNLCEGRYTVSVGSGYRAYEFEPFGLNIDDNRERTREAVEVLQLAFTKDRFSFDGRHFQYRNVTIRPRPVQSNMPIWLTTSSPAQVEWAAKQGIGVLPAAGLSYPLIKQDRDTYVKTATEAGHNPKAHDAPAFKWIYVAETDAKARAGAEKAFLETFMAFFQGGERLVKHVMGRFGQSRDAADPNKRFDYLTSDDCMACVYGSPETVRSKLAPLRECGVDYFIGGFNIGALPTDEIRKSMKLYAEKVMPHL